MTNEDQTTTNRLKVHADSIERQITGKRKHARQLIEDALSITIIYEGNPYQTPEATGARILLTTGGPHIEIEIENGSQWATIKTLWSGTRYETEVNAPKLTDEIEMLINDQTL